MKKMILALIAVTCALVGAAFTSPKNVVKKQGYNPQYWFELVTNGNPSVATDYFLAGGTGENPPTGCTDLKLHPCGILADMQGISDPDPGYPDLTTISDDVKRDNP